MSKEQRMGSQKWRIRGVTLFNNVGKVGVAQYNRFTRTEGWTVEEQENGDVIVTKAIKPGIPTSEPITQRYRLGCGSFWTDYEPDPES